MIVNIKNTMKILADYNIKPQKKFGQNFLIDRNILHKLITSSGINKDDGVIEIGPGIGALTEALLKAAKKVMAYEIDTRFVEILENELKEYNNLKIINKDFLKACVKDDLDWFTGCNRILVVSNLPYYITSPIIMKLLKEDSLLHEFYLMVQKEVGVRLTSGPGGKNYGALSVLMNYQTNSELMFEVSKHCFYPKPDVESAVVAIKKKKPSVIFKSENEFLRFIRIIFSQRRKTFINNVAGHYHFKKQKIQTVLCELNLHYNIRSENLTLQNIFDIYQKLFESPN